MAAGFPVKADYASGDVLTAAQMNDLSGTLNYLDPTAKGDLFPASSGTALTRLAVGANDTVLTADSSTATGLKWAAPAGGGGAPFLAPIVAGTFYQRQRTTTSGAEVPTSNETTYSPVFLPNATFDRIAIRAAGPGTATTARLGIYNADPTTGLPSTVLLDAGTVSVNAFAEFSITINQTITQGFYYLACNAQGAVGSIEFAVGGFTAVNPIPMANVYSAFGSSVSPILGYLETGVSGAFATAGTLTTSSNTNKFPIQALRVA